MDISTIFSEYGDYVLKVIKRTVKTPEDAEDIAQNLWLGMLEGPDFEVRSEGETKNFLKLRVKWAVASFYKADTKKSLCEKEATFISHAEVEKFIQENPDPHVIESQCYDRLLDWNMPDTILEVEEKARDFTSQTDSIDLHIWYLSRLNRLSYKQISELLDIDMSDVVKSINRIKSVAEGIYDA